MKRWLIPTMAHTVPGNSRSHHHLCQQTELSPPSHRVHTERRQRWPLDRMKQGSDGGSSSYRCPAIQTEQDTYSSPFQTGNIEEKIEWIKRWTSYGSGDVTDSTYFHQITEPVFFFFPKWHKINKIKCAWSERSRLTQGRYDASMTSWVHSHIPLLQKQSYLFAGKSIELIY